MIPINTNNAQEVEQFLCSLHRGIFQSFLTSVQRSGKLVLQPSRRECTVNGSSATFELNDGVEDLRIRIECIIFPEEQPLKAFCAQMAVVPVPVEEFTFMPWRHGKVAYYYSTAVGDNDPAISTFGDNDGPMPFIECELHRSSRAMVLQRIGTETKIHFPEGGIVLMSRSVVVLLSTTDAVVGYISFR